jgi:hypothetical protein
MISLDFSYKENRIFGLVALKVQIIDSKFDLSEPILFSINGSERANIGISIDYLNNNRIVFFCLNTYKINNGHATLEISSGDYRDGVDLFVENDTPAGKFNDQYFNNLSVFLPYPVSSKIWDDFSKKDFPVKPDYSLYQKDEIQHFQSKGWIILDNILDLNLISQAKEQIETECLNGYGGYIEGSSSRIQHLHFKKGPIREIYQNLKLRRYISAIFGTPMSPCQTLCYRYGSQQSFHSDYVHLTSFPENLMCGVWIALEDVDVDAGPLGLISGSHLLPKLTMKDFGLESIVNNNYSIFESTFNKEWLNYTQTKTTEFALLKKGQILVWDGNLLHSGTQRFVNDKTRHSVVLHYFGDGAVCIYDALGVVGNPG